MNHIDAGTIHAWLDGALDATRSREIEAHVAECSICSAAVAEERGMIAGASRILLALDDVPAGVTKRAPATAPVVPRRQWRAAPWVTGIAAALILAVGITTLRRQTGQNQPANDQVVAVPAAPGPAVQQPVVPPVAPLARVETKTEPQRDRQPAAALSAGGTASRTSERRAVAMEKATAQVGGAAGAAAPQAARPIAVSEPTRTAAAPLPVPPSAGAAAGAGLAIANRAMVDAARERGKRDETVRVSELAGCYEVKPAEPGKGLAASVSAGVEAASKRVARAQAPAAGRAEYSAAALGASGPSIVRLDTARKRPGYAVRAATSDSLIGFWNLTGDSATADLLVRGTFAISQRNRVDCPER
jgi:hypothetical protein